MRTAIFVYQTTSLSFNPSESNLELEAMNSSTITLASGPSSHSLAPGVYKVVSEQCIGLTGEDGKFQYVVTTQNKQNDPAIPPSQALTSLSLDMTAVNAWLAEPEAKALAHA